MNIDTTKTIYLLKLLEVLRDLGLPVGPLLRHAGLNQDDLTDRERLLPIEKYLLAVEDAVKLSNIPDLGFRVGEQTSPMEHGVLGYALLSSPNLRESLKRYVRYQNLQGPLLTVSYLESGDTASMTATPRRGRWRMSPLGYRYIVQEWLVGWNQWCQIIGCSGSFFEHIRLGYTADNGGKYYEEHLGCTVSFDNQDTTAVFPARRLDLPIEYADASIAALCSVQCEKLLEALSLRPGLVTEIHRQLANLPGQIPAMDAMANRLHVGTRTLRRRLKEEGTTYQQVVTEFRVAMARRYLEETTLPANEVAALVGYSDPANLYRTFQKKIGVTPSEYRKSSTTV